MAVLTNIQGQRHISPCGERMERMNHIFDAYNQHGRIIRMLIAWIAGAIVVYLVAVYSLFGLGITLQEKTIELKKLTEANIISELNLRQKQTEFARNNEDILQSMEKITNLRYITPADTAVSQVEFFRTNQ